MDISFTEEIDYHLYRPLTLDAELSMRACSPETLKEYGGTEVYVDSYFVGYAGFVEKDNSMFFWVMPDINMVSYMFTVFKLMKNILQYYEKENKPMYAHVMNGNHGLVERLGFKKTNISVNFAGLKLDRWEYDRTRTTIG